MESQFIRKLDESNLEIRELKQKLSRAESKVLSRAQKKPQAKKPLEPSEYATAEKKIGTESIQSGGKALDVSTHNKSQLVPSTQKKIGDFILDSSSVKTGQAKPSQNAKPTGSNNVSKPNSNTNVNSATTISNTDIKGGKNGAISGSVGNNKNTQQLQKQALIKRKLEEQKKQLQRRQMAQKQNQQQQLRISQFQNFLTATHNLRDLLQTKAKIIEIEFEKQKLYWNQQRTRYQTQISQLNFKIEEKDKKIEEMIVKIAELKQLLKAKMEECEQKTKIIATLNKEAQQLKQEKAKLILENKSLKADNKVIISHLDKLLKQQRDNSQKTAREIFEQRQKRVLNALYTKTVSPVVTQTNNSFLPSERNELTNKLKLQQTLEQYANHRQESNRKICQLQKGVSTRDSEIQNLKRRIYVLQDSLKKLNELRDLERESQKKQSKVIQEYEKNFEELRDHNECLEGELEKYYKIPRFKEKIGCISRLRRIKDVQSS